MISIASLKRKIDYKINKCLRDIYIYLNRKDLAKFRPNVLSNNCWAGLMYKDLNISYPTPFVNMYIPAPDFIKLVKNLDFYLEQTLEFVKSSKYDSINKTRTEEYYPLGLLGDVEIHFIHYQDEASTLEKWRERVNRFSKDELIVIMSERDFCTENEIREFDTLPFSNKYCFTAKSYNLKSTLQLKRFSGRKEVPGADEIIGYCYWKMPLLKILENLK